MNMKTLAQELGFDVEDVSMLLEVFLESAKENLTKLKNAAKTNDYMVMRDTAHALKGSASNLLFNEIVMHALQIELSANNQKEIDYLMHIDEIERCLTQLDKTK